MKNRKVLRFSSIFLINLIIKEFIDALLTPIIMFEFGLIKCFIFTMIVYSIKGFITVRLYDYYRTDCIMMEGLKEAQHNNNQINEYNKLVKFIIKKSKNNRKKLILLLAFKNPGLPVLYMRDGFYLYDGFTNTRIIYYFFLNIFIMNIYWNTIVFTGFSLWETFKNIF